MKSFITFCSLIVCLPSMVHAQGCYGGNYGTPSPYPLTAVIPGQTQTLTIPVTITVSTPDTVVAAPAPLAAPAPVCQSIGLVQPYTQAYVQSYAVGSTCGASLGVGYQGFNQGFANQRLTGNFNRFGLGATPVLSGTGVAASFVDRRGNSIQAVGARNVRVQRDLFGRIRGANVDSNRNLFGRILPF